MTSQAQRRAATIAAIISAASELFTASGFDATSIDDIASSAGVAKGAFYHHFESKDEVLQALARRLAEEAHALYAPMAARADLTPLEKLTTLFGLGMQFKKDHVTAVRAFAKVYYPEENLRLRARITGMRCERR